jgi:hypothetical protein
MSHLPWLKAGVWGVRRGPFGVLAVAAAVVFFGGGPPAHADLTITPHFTANFVTDFGANAGAAEAAWEAAASVYTSTFNNNIHINITVDAVAGTSVFGQSSTFLNSFFYATMRNAVVANATSADQLTSVGPGGSVSATDPVGGTHTWWVTTAQAKALGLIADNMSTDGITTFGAGNPFSFSGTPRAGTYDFKGVAAHEISEVMGRLGISGGTIGNSTNSYSLIDLFSYTGANTRGLIGGPGNNFSINNGTTLLKLYNNSAQNGLDSRDWAPGTNDSFNQFANSGVVNPVSAVDIREMNVIGYNLIPTAVVPEPSSMLMAVLGALGLSAYGWRRRRQKSEGTVA